MRPKSLTRARQSTHLLRNLENQSEDFATAVFDEERAFNSQLVEIYGKPYAGDIGPGKTYEQDYNGPDLYRYMYIDEPFHFEEPLADSSDFLLTKPSEDNSFDPLTYDLGTNPFEPARSGRRGRSRIGRYRPRQ